MRAKFSWSRGAVLAAVIVLPLKAGACGGHTACFTYSQAAYDKAGGACPSGITALSRFRDTSCGDTGPVDALNGDGSFDGEFCCYPVTPSPDSSGFSDCEVGGVGGSFETSAVGAGGSSQSMTAGGFSDATVTSSTGVLFDAGVCGSCAAELESDAADPTQLCPAASMSWFALENCLCNGGACSGACSTNACVGEAPDSGCLACINDPSMMGCGAQISDCMAH